MTIPNNPGDPYSVEFTLPADADTLPVAVAIRNGAADPDFALTVTPLGAGRYSVTGTIPAGYAAGDVVVIAVAATVAGIPGAYAVGRFVVSPAVVDPAAVDAAILAALSTPEMVQSDAGTVKTRSLSDLLAARNYLAGLAAAAGNIPGLGLRFRKLIPDGTVEGRRYGRDFNGRCR